MASKADGKEVRSLLKAAKVALGRKEHEEVDRICKEIFERDSGNYTAHVFAGVALLELQRREEAKTHYQAAIQTHPEEQLAWKGLADYYGKCPPRSPEEQLDAIMTFKSLLPFIERDMDKNRSTLQKLASLHVAVGNCDEALSVYDRLLATYPEEEGGEMVRLWKEVLTYLYGLDYNTLPDQAGNMLKRGVSAVLSCSTVGEDERMKVRLKYVTIRYEQFLKGPTRHSGLEEEIKQECYRVLERDSSSVPALTVLTRFVLMDIATVVPSEDIDGIPLTPEQYGVFSKLATATTADQTEMEAESTRSGSDRTFFTRETGGGRRGLEYVGQAIFLTKEGKWREAGEIAAKGVPLSGLCESWLVSSCIQLHLCNFATAQAHAMEGLAVLKAAPAYMADIYGSNLRLCLAKSYLGLGRADEAVSILVELPDVTAGGSRGAVSLVKAYLLQGNMTRAKEVLCEVESVLGTESHAVLGLQGDICLTEEDYTTAVNRFDSAVQLKPDIAYYHFARGLCLWRGGGDKKEAYAAFLKAAKANPFNPDVFIQLGHYHKLVTNGLRRATKCYQKAIDLQPNHVEAALSLADAHFASGDEEAAFHLYEEIVSKAPKTEAYQAWLRMGLYQQKKKLYSEAIKSFQNGTRADPLAKHCWECLGEAYFARGSYNSAINAFTKAIELDSKSLYCLYQVARIKQLLGLLNEAVSDYTAVLDLEPYVPAFKGRGESNLELARLALQDNFDGRAVDYVTLALRDITIAAHRRPQFACLWKLIGDCCVCLHGVAADVARPSIPQVLLGQTTARLDENTVTTKHELLRIGCRAYGRALELTSDSDSLWHDVAISYYFLGLETDQDKAERQHHFRTALGALRKAVSLQPHSYSHWNALGVVATQPEVSSPALAQHAFIKSIQEENNAVAWTNLGTLYLKHGNMKLAHEAFRNAQSLQPSYVQAWIGQALIAESIGHSESMELFRHTVELGYHPEGGVSYGYWVCSTLSTMEPQMVLSSDGASLNAVAMKEALQARDCLQKYLMREGKRDACAFNFLGLLYEQEGLLRLAEKAFLSALELLEERESTSSANIAAVRANRGRVLSMLERHSESLSTFASVIEGADLSTQLTLALALYRSNKLKESLQAYERILPSIEKEGHKPLVLTAAAIVAFAQKDYQKCKTLLFEAFQTPPPSLHSLVSLCVFGCWTSDFTLLQAALNETVETIDWQSGTGPLLHPTFSKVLKAMEIILKEKQKGEECMEKLTTLLANTARQGEVPFPLFILHSVKAASNRSQYILVIQKLVHSYPSDIWSKAALMYFLGDNRSLAINYQEVVLLQVQTELNRLSSKEVQTRWDQSQHNALLSLQKWALDAL